MPAVALFGPAYHGMKIFHSFCEIANRTLVH